MVTARISMNFLQEGKNAVCTFDLANNKFDNFDAMAEESLENIAEGWITNVRPLVSPNLTLVDVRWNIPFLEFVRNVGSAGTLSGIAMPPNNAVLIQKVNVGAPKGRMYHPGIGTGQANGAGVINSGHLTNWRNAVELWLLEINKDADGTAQRMVVKAKDGTNTDVGSLNVRSVIASQRRRLK